jgi:hypothetical protein
LGGFVKGLIEGLVDPSKFLGNCDKESGEFEEELEVSIN